MFNYADSDRDGRINYKVDNYKCRLFFQIEFLKGKKSVAAFEVRGFPMVSLCPISLKTRIKWFKDFFQEFQTMINPPKPPEPPKPSIRDYTAVQVHCILSLAVLFILYTAVQVHVYFH